MGSHSLIIHFVSLSDSAIFGDGVIPYLSVPLVCMCVCVQSANCTRLAETITALNL